MPLQLLNQYHVTQSLDVRKLEEKESLKNMGRRYLEDVGMGCIPLNIQVYSPFSFQVV